MKHIFLMGGCSGFLLAGLAGGWAGHAADRLLLDAAIGCLCGATLFRWFWTVLIRSIRVTILERQTSKPPAPVETE